MIRPIGFVVAIMLGFTSGVHSGVSSTLEYGAGLDNTYWSVEGSVFDCSFSQSIPGYGQAIFYHRAGEDIEFRLYSERNTMDYSAAQISMLPPPWRPSESSENLGEAMVRKGDVLLTLDSRRSNIFLHGLMEGRRPTITHHTGYDLQRFVRLYISDTSFEDYYPEYMRCVRQLLPMNFDQVRRMKVLFGSGEDKIDQTDQNILDRVIFYVLVDPRITAIYLDGHSDNVGRRYDNRQISLRRVIDVKNYMLAQGIADDLITTRFHGGRYPVADNKSPVGRAANRRVTIRLEMDDSIPIPENLKFPTSLPAGLTTSSNTSTKLMENNGL